MSARPLRVAIRRVLLFRGKGPVNRTVSLVDGFNLYHGLAEAAGQVGETTKWLDLKKRCTAYLSFGSAIGRRAGRSLAATGVNC